MHTEERAKQALRFSVATTLGETLSLSYEEVDEMSPQTPQNSSKTISRKLKDFSGWKFRSPL